MPEFDELAFLKGEARMRSHRPVNDKPNCQPEKAKAAHQKESVAPANRRIQPACDERRGEHSAHACTCVEYGHASSSLTLWEPLGDHLCGAWPVAGLSQSEEEAADSEAQVAANKTLRHGCTTPHDHRD